MLPDGDSSHEARQRSPSAPRAGAAGSRTRGHSTPRTTAPNLLAVRAMNDTVNTATEEREQWRARILRALAELRGEELAVGGKRRDEGREDGSTSD